MTFSKNNLNKIKNLFEEILIKKTLTIYFIYIKNYNSVILKSFLVILLMNILALELKIVFQLM